MKFLLLILSCFILTESYANKYDADTTAHKICLDTIILDFCDNDTIVFKTLVSKVRNDSIALKPLNEIIEYTARFFINTPYGYPSRHYSGKEKLMIGFEKFDCVTFVESVLALAIIFKNQKTEFCDFANELQKVRYKNGKVGAFPFRLHYFSDWIYNNEQKRIISDLSGKIDTMPWKKKINYMTSHKKKYMQLKDTSFNNQLKKIEKELSTRKKYYLPKENFDKYKSEIKTGDILVLTVNTVGLDVSHTGFAVWIENDLYFLHASKSKRQVSITKTPFKDYIMKIKKVTGVLVARPLTSVP